MTCSDSRNRRFKLLCEPSRLQIGDFFTFSLFTFDFSIEISLVRKPTVSQSSYESLAFSLVGDPQCCFNKRNQALKPELLSTISTTRSTPNKNYARTLTTEPGVARPLFYTTVRHFLCSRKLQHNCLKITRKSRSNWVPKYAKMQESTLHFKTFRGGHPRTPLA